jgi:hypothetical protein
MIPEAARVHHPYRPYRVHEADPLRGRQAGVQEEGRRARGDEGVHGDECGEVVPGDERNGLRPFEGAVPEPGHRVPSPVRQPGEGEHLPFRDDRRVVRRIGRGRKDGKGHGPQAPSTIPAAKRAPNRTPRRAVRPSVALRARPRSRAT